MNQDVDNQILSMVRLPYLIYYSELDIESYSTASWSITNDAGTLFELAGIFVLNIWAENYYPLHLSSGPARLTLLHRAKVNNIVELITLVRLTTLNVNIHLLTN